MVLGSRAHYREAIARVATRSTRREVADIVSYVDDVAVLLWDHLARGT